jgi:hypothetical protein
MVTRRRRKGEEEKQTNLLPGTKINRQDFLLALEKVKPGVANKELIEQSNHFIFDKDNIWTYNDEVSVSLKFPSEITGSIKAQEFYAMLDKISSSNIYLQQEDNKLFVRAKDFEAAINVAQIAIKTDRLRPPDVKSKLWKSLPKNFIDAVSFCVFSAGTNMILVEFTCIWLTKKDKQGLAISCDGYRGTRYKLSSVLDDDLLIPLSTAKHMRVYNPVKYALDEYWMHFINAENITFSSRIIASEYNPGVWNFFNVKDSKPIVLPEKFKPVVERVETIVVEDFAQDRCLTITIDDGKIECRGEGQLGYIKEQADIKHKGKKIKFQIHPKLFGDILTHTSNMIVSERLKFKTDDFEHVICLSQVSSDD